jgi:hypothetical protein
LKVQKNRRVVGINGDNRAEAVVRGDLGQHDRGAPLKAANFDDHAFRGSAGGEETEEAGLLFRKMSRNLLTGLPGLVEDSGEVRRNGDRGQNTLPSGGRNCAYSARCEQHKCERKRSGVARANPPAIVAVFAVGGR